MNQNRNYRIDIDLIKGLAIIAVVAYHIGICPSGYLGVDTFFVVNGFLVIPAICARLEKNDFHYFSFVYKKIIRLLPALLVILTVSLLTGLIAMIPDDYLTLSESVVASVFFSNNLLSLFLCADYWDWTNDFKPLMHTWYLGVLFEFYVFVPIIMLIANRFRKHGRLSQKKNQIIVLGILSLLSFASFVYPGIGSEIKFYIFFPRLFEFLIGGIVGIAVKDVDKDILDKKAFRIIKVLLFALLTVLLFMGFVKGEINNTVFLPVVSVISMLLLVFPDYLRKDNIFINCFSVIGRASYSIFLWHQVILAFYRYYYSTDINVKFWIIYIPLLSLFSYLSYVFVEKKVRIENIKSALCLGTMCALLCLYGFVMWTRAGVIRDIPELNVDSDNIIRRQNPEYVDRI